MSTLSQAHRTAIVNAAIIDGIEDYCAGVPVQLCPYTKRAYRAAWLKGWHQVDKEVSTSIELDAERQHA